MAHVNIDSSKIGTNCVVLDHSDDDEAMQELSIQKSEQELELLETLEWVEGAYDVLIDFLNFDIDEYGSDDLEEMREALSRMHSDCASAMQRISKLGETLDNMDAIS